MGRLDNHIKYFKYFQSLNTVTFITIRRVQLLQANSFKIIKKDALPQTCP